MRRGALIFNPAAGGGRAALVAARVRELLCGEGWRVEPAPTTHAGHATELARRLGAAGGIEAVFALGGDGTMREVACGLLGGEVALAPLPGGTTNVLHLSLGLPADPLAAAHLLAAGVRRHLAVGLAGEQPFLMAVSAGIDAAVVAAMGGRLKARLGRAGVALQGLGVWWGYRFPPVTVRFQGREERAFHAVVANLPHYGGPFLLAPGARPEEASLELVLHLAGGRAAALGFALDLLRGRHLERRDVVAARVDEVLLDAAAPVPLQVDGDVCGAQTPLRVRPATQTLPVLVPE